MKVLFITPYYKPSWFYGGPPKCISEQAESLQQHQSIHLEVVTLNLNGDEALFPGQDSIVIKELNGVKVHYLSVANNPLGKKYFVASNMAIYLEKFKDYDLVHVHTLFNFVSKSGMTFALTNGIPYVVTPHGMLDEVALSRSALLKRIHRFFYEDRLLKNAKFIQFTTNGEMKDAVLKKSSNAGVIPLGVQFIAYTKTNVLRGRKTDNIFRLVFLGRINKIKGINLLLEALYVIQNKYGAAVQLDIYGDDDDNHLNELLLVKKNLNLTHIEFKGKLDPALRDITLSQYDALVLTSYLESFGLVVVEALHLGLPVLISDRVKLADFVLANKCGWVATLNTAAIASAIENAFETPMNVRQEMGARGAKAVRESFSLDKVTEDLIRLYKNLKNA